MRQPLHFWLYVGLGMILIISSVVRLPFIRANR
ncbi:hypothetical protein H4W01_003711 [Sphingomonas sp. PL20]|jgi:hypothetical protein